MATTPHLGLTLLEQAQAQKEITINEGLARLDAMLNSGVVDRDLATPPGSPVNGDVYIVAASPTGAWSGKAKHIAYFDQIWCFIAPREGAMLWVNDENLHVVYDGSNGTYSTAAWPRANGMPRANFMKLSHKTRLASATLRVRNVTPNGVAHVR